MENNTLLGRDLDDFEISYSMIGRQRAVMPDVYCGDALSGIEIKLEMHEDPEYKTDGKITVATAHIVRIPSSDTIVNQKAYGLDYDMYDMLDECGDVDLRTVAAEFNSSPNCDVCIAVNDNDIYYVQKFVVNNKFRNQGVGTFCMQMLPKWIRAIYGGYRSIISLIPGPIECDKENKTKYNKEKRRLVNFYKRVGFKNLKPRSGVLYYIFPEDEYTTEEED